MAAQVVPRQAASPGPKLLHIRGQRQTQRGARGFPQGIPQALGVKHQPVHIKNNAFYHRCHPFAKHNFLYCTAVSDMMQEKRLLTRGKLSMSKNIYFAL